MSGFVFSPIPTEEFKAVWRGYRDKKGVVSSGKPKLLEGVDVIVHEAVWKFPSIKKWERVASLEGRSFVEGVWLNFLKSCTLCPGVEVEEDQPFPREVFREKILRSVPSRIAMNLYNQFFVSTQVLKVEEREIEKGCMIIFRSSSRTRSREDKHPILSKVMNSQGLYNTLGITLFDDVQNIHIREMTLIIICLNNLAAVKRIHHETAELVRKAKNPGRSSPR